MNRILLAVPLCLSLAAPAAAQPDKDAIKKVEAVFEPAEAKPGQTVTLELLNEGNNPHTLTISDQGVDTEVQPGDEAEAEVTFPQSGQLAFVCKFHESNGMVGALEAASTSSRSTTTPQTTTSQTTTSDDSDY